MPILQGPGQLFRADDGAAVVKGRRRHAGWSHELNIQNSLLRRFGHILQSGQSADIGDFMRVGNNRRRPQGNDEAAEFFRTDVGRLDVDMAVDEARRGIPPSGIDDAPPFVRTADTGEDAVYDSNVPFPYRLGMHVDNTAVFKNQVAGNDPWAASILRFNKSLYAEAISNSPLFANYRYSYCTIPAAGKPKHLAEKHLLYDKFI